MGGSRLFSLGMENAEKSSTSSKCRGRSSELKPIWCCSAGRSDAPADCCACARSDAQYCDSDANDGGPCGCLERNGETGKQAGGDALAAREEGGVAGDGAEEGGGRRGRWKRGTPEGEERGVGVEGLHGDGVLHERRRAFLAVRRLPRGYQGDGLPEGAVEEEEGDPREGAAEADDAVAVERVGGAGEHGFPAVFAEKRPVELGGQELPDVDEIVAGAGDAERERREEEREYPPMRRMESR